jgi:hypothetical protein
MTRCPHTHTAAEGNNHRDPQEPHHESHYDEQASCMYMGSRSHSFVPPQAYADTCLVMSTALGNAEPCATIPTMLIITTVYYGNSITRRGLSQEPHRAGVGSFSLPRKCVTAFLAPVVLPCHTHAGRARLPHAVRSLSGTYGYHGPAGVYRVLSPACVIFSL